MNRCPQTEAEFINYFFALINRRLGGPADDWREVMSAKYNWKGTEMQIPHNTPDHGKKHPSDAPFFGLSQQWSGGPKARVWGPSNTPDDGWFRFYRQYIKDDPNNPGHFLWDWSRWSTNGYDPLLTDVQQPPTTEPPPVEPTDPELKVRVQVLEQKVESLYLTLERFALQSIANGKYVANELGEGCILRGNRDEAQGWEEFKIVRKG